MSKLTISVALCSYNGEKYVREQLASIAGQSRLPDELIVRDDRSTDRTVAIVEEFSRAVSFPVRLRINELQLGAAANFGQAIGDCSGDLILLADQDDYWRKDKLAIFEEVFASQPEVDVAFSDADLVDADLRSLGLTQWQSIRFFEEEQRQMSSGNAMRTLIHHNVVQGAAMAFRSRLRDRILPIPPDAMHDAWIALVVGVAGRIQPIPQPLLMYRQHGGNQLGSYVESSVFASAIGVMRSDRARHVATIRTALRMCEHLRERLAATADNSPARTLNFELDKKIKHLHARTRIVQRGFAWFLLWTRELLLMRYRRYSVGFWSAGYDVLQGVLQSEKKAK